MDKGYEKEQFESLKIKAPVAKKFRRFCKKMSQSQSMTLQLMLDFFEKNGFDDEEGKKFFEHYEARNWQTSDGQTIRDWRALATNWMDRTELFDEKKESNKKQASQIKDNLRTTKNKN